MIVCVGCVSWLCACCVLCVRVGGVGVQGIVWVFVNVLVFVSLSVYVFNCTQTRHRCTSAHLLPLSSDLSDSYDHSPNAFALAQGCARKTELHLT